jgi:hypothetical protein
LDIQHAEVTLNGLAAGTNEVSYAWASALAPALTGEELTHRVTIEVQQGAASAASRITIEANGKFGDGTGYLYAAVSALSAEVARAEMNLAILYGMDSSFYNLDFIYGTYGAEDDGENEAYPLFISKSGTKKTAGHWRFKRPIITGVRQLHPVNHNSVTITQS